ncbi:phosphotransferase [Pelagibacteraceae bacterium]|jgi:aminoglycoside/choline kinase family phosphotransferase|nr:phosphotransferase [Pelagibacteraceae bacterium]
MSYKIEKISGDASFREFYRVQKNTKSSILVLAKKDKYKNIFTYCAINEILNKNKILAPKVINNFKQDNIIEISDLGKKSFCEFIKNKKNKIPEYKKLIELILKIQKIKLNNSYKFNNKIIRFEKHSLKNLHKESDLFFNWYLSYKIKKKKLARIKTEIKKELNEVYKKLYFKNIYFVHRDFHVSNIILSGKKLGLIDSQDAIIGNPLYDLASLIDDVRVNLSKKNQDILFRYYIQKSKFLKKDQLNLKNDFDILSVQRNLKILGIFVRLLKRDGKSNYIKYLPRTWKLLEVRLKNSIFDRLKKVINKNISIKKMKKFRFK